MEISIFLKNKLTKLQSFFQKLVYFSHRSEQGRVGKTPIKNAIGAEKTVSSHLK